MLTLRYQAGHHHRGWDPFGKVAQPIFYHILTLLRISLQDLPLLLVYDDDSSIHPLFLPPQNNATTLSSDHEYPDRTPQQTALHRES